MINLSLIYDFDHSIGKAVNSFLNYSNGFFTDFLRFVTTLGNSGLVFIIAAIIMLLFFKTGKAGAISLIALLFGFLLTNLLLKNVVARLRPYIDTNSDFYFWWKSAGSLLESGFSFPSGHTTAATGFGFSLFICFKKRISWLYLLIPIFMGFTRIYFMVHYASDVVGALFVGIVCSTCSYFTFKGISKFKFIDKAYNLPSILSLFKREA